MPRKRKLLADIHGDSIAIGTPGRRRYVISLEDVYLAAKTWYTVKQEEFQANMDKLAESLGATVRRMQK